MVAQNFHYGEVCFHVVFTSIFFWECYGAQTIIRQANTPSQYCVTVLLKIVKVDIIKLWIGEQGF
jgi:hypothetical protein